LLELFRWLDRLRRAPPTARAAALEQLLRIDVEGAFTGLVGGSPTRANGAPDADEPSTAASTGTAAERQPLTPRDRRVVTELVAGVTRWQRRLAWTLTNLPKETVLRNMDPPLRLLLLMGTYDLLELGMAPHAINEYVDLAKLVMHDGCAKVANGVLRNVVRCKEAGTLPRPPPPSPGASMDETAEALALATSHPTWLVKRWLKEFGVDETRKLLQRNNA